MAISIHSNRFAAAYHNMSAPPRTRVELPRFPVTGKIVVFSLNYALFVGDHVYGFNPVTSTPLEKALEIHDEVYGTVTRSSRTPDHLFAKIGDPIFPKIDADFLIGWRPQKGDTHLEALVCTDPRVCAGVLSRCAGTLYLSRREPTFTWEQLLRAPIAFDDSLITL
jgi:hypothetical protein